jgi:transposase
MPTIAAEFVFTRHDRRRLAAAMRQVRDACHCRRLQAVLLVAEGGQVGEAAALLKASRSWVTKTLARYRARRSPGDLAEGARSGRPPLAPSLSCAELQSALQADPLALGYAATGWTAPLLAARLHRLLGKRQALSVRTLRRCLRAAGWVWKRPRDVFGAKEPHRAQKKGRSCAA